MNTSSGRVLVLALALLLNLPAAGAETRDKARMTDPDTISAFCPVKSPGQLCTHGTADLLKLEGVKREQWIAAVRRYNKQVQDGQARILEEARGILTPEQTTLVKSFFDPASAKP